MLRHEALPASLLRQPPASLPTLFGKETSPSQDGCRVTPGLGATASLSGLLGPEGPRPRATRCLLAPKSRTRAAAPRHGAPSEVWGAEGRLAAEGPRGRLPLSSRDRKALRRAALSASLIGIAAARSPTQRRCGGCGKSGRRHPRGSAPPPWGLPRSPPGPGCPLGGCSAPRSTRVALPHAHTRVCAALARQERSTHHELWGWRCHPGPAERGGTLVPPHHVHRDAIRTMASPAVTPSPPPPQCWQHPQNFPNPKAHCSLQEL